MNIQRSALCSTTTKNADYTICSRIHHAISPDIISAKLENNFRLNKKMQINMRSNRYKGIFTHCHYIKLFAAI